MNFTLSRNASHTSDHRPPRLRLWSVMLWLLVWQLGSQALGQEILLVSPVSVLVRLSSLIRTFPFWESIGFSLARISLGFLLAAFWGTLFAALAARFAGFQDLLTPLILAIKATPVASFIILALIWRWTGYNMVFYLAGLQNIEYSVYEAARIDGASPLQTFFKITVPLLKPTILLTTITSTNGTLQLFDESVNLTNGGPANATITMSHYIYNTCFLRAPNFGYGSAMAFFVFIIVAILAFINLKVGDTRD